MLQICETHICIIAPGQHSSFRRNVAAVASHWQHCVRFDRPVVVFFYCRAKANTQVASSANIRRHDLADEKKRKTKIRTSLNQATRWPSLLLLQRFEPQSSVPETNVLPLEQPKLGYELKK